MAYGLVEEALKANSLLIRRSTSLFSESADRSSSLIVSPVAESDSSQRR